MKRFAIICYLGCLPNCLTKSKGKENWFSFEILSRCKMTCFGNHFLSLVSEYKIGLSTIRNVFNTILNSGKHSTDVSKFIDVFVDHIVYIPGGGCSV